MFTGIVSAVGVVRRLIEAEGLRRLRIETPPGWLAGVGVGESIAVDGACLTPVHVDDDGFEVEAVASTLERTVAGRYRPEARVNLEKALRMGDRLDGHWVQGHVDGIARFEGLRRTGETRFLAFTLPPEVWALSIVHGSITLNGVSLTIHALGPQARCEVAIIPHTWTHTNLSDLEPDDPVNVEGDMMGKYASRILDPRSGGGAMEP
ncbi:MAG: riboflavin synthase [Longimicrobiales bacterium]|nr:riboflavin synthase [Longimicrobiales bacterium]